VVGEQPADGPVHVEVLAFAAPRDSDVRAAQEADKDAAWHLEQGVTVR
jgi:hypothetical protein